MCLLLHNTFGGFSPPAATKIRRLGRAARGGVDRTSYSTRHSKTRPYVVHHTQRISKTIVHCDATAALDINAPFTRRMRGTMCSRRAACGTCTVRACSRSP